MVLKKVPRKKSSVKAAPMKKASKKVSPAPAATPSPEPVPADVAVDSATGVPQVRVQMFRHGLGDSFLVTLDASGANERRILIDCGSLGNKVSDVNTQQIAGYLQTLIDDGKRIDFLVATHEHQDHVSGFRNDLPPVLTGHVGQVWLAWTENPADEAAQNLSTFQNDLVSALRGVAKVAAGLKSPVSNQISDVLGFTGEPLLGAKFATTVNEAMDYVRTRTGASTRYLVPGDLITESDVPGFRIYVLGPPRSESALKNIGEHGSDELYHLAMSLERTAARHGEGVLDPVTSDLPFEDRYSQSGQALMGKQYPQYVEPRNDWRRIDLDWLDGASDLALQLDNLTNNTSLVLAIERIADGKVLLFPADAQEGNWLSWHDPALKWTITDSGGASRVVKAADLLARTVFYKVGHHGSHNATARGKGLELMTRQDELVAFIPVDRALALTRSPAGSWKMPARPLYRELLKRCQGRVVRADLGWAAAAPTGSSDEEEFNGLASPADWEAWATKQQQATHVRFDNPLFVEYLLQ